MSTNPKWPWPGESPLDRARRIAISYRTHLHAKAPQVCAELDRAAVAVGEGWIAPHLVAHEPTDPLTTSQAAEMAGVSVWLVRRWACMTHPDRPDEPLLPRYRRIGREMTYLAQHVEAAAEAYRRAHAGRRLA